MMKQLGFAMFFVALFVLGTTAASAQMITSQARQETADQATMESQFKSLDGLIDVTVAARRPAANLDQSTLSRSEGKVDGQSVPSGPGDHPIFVLRANHQFLNEGDTLELSFIPMVTMSKVLNGSVQILKPGYDGEFDGSIPVSYAPFATPTQELRNIQTLQPIKILSRTFNSEDNPGRYSFNIATWNSHGGLEQQIIVDVYYGYAGRYGRYNYVSKITANVSETVLIGRFPIGVPVYYYIGSKFGAMITGSDPNYAPKSNGTKLVVAPWSKSNVTIPADLMFWAPGSRYAIVNPVAIVDDVAPF